jgi:AAA domain (dynein-related subfamily)
MSYFDLESDNFQHYFKAIDKPYDVAIHKNETKWFNDTQQKIASLLSELLKDSEIDLSPPIHLDPLPDGSKKTIKRYILVQCLPKDYTKSLPKKNKYHRSAFIGLGIYIHSKDNVTFGIGVDDPSKKNAERKILQSSYKVWAIGKLSIKDSKLLLLPTDFDAIISEIKPVLNEYIKQFRQKFMNENNATDSLPKVEPTQYVAVPRQFPLNQILFGPPGTGKTYNTINKALAIIEIAKEDDLQKEDRTDLKGRFDNYLESGQIMFTTFHQNMSYEDFIEGIKPIPPKDGEQMTYKVKKGIFRKICKKAKKATRMSDSDFETAYEAFITYMKEKEVSEPIEFKTPARKSTFTVKVNGNNNLTVANRSAVSVTKEMLQQHLNGEKTTEDTYAPPVGDYLKTNFFQIPNYVLIIDEINRGNVSKIFGELITLIEDDKRLGEDEALKITLPYSKKKFGVPNNLYIIGTMNTADRSVEALDTALRRRFNFVEMPPNYDLPQLNTKICDYELVNILKTINKRIEKLLGRDNLIGHSYFLSVKNESDLKAAFQNKIIPLLQEYFFGDYGKIGLVLGNGFVEKDGSMDDFFTDFDYKAKVQLAKKETYCLKNVIDMKPETFKTALDNMKIK